MMIVSYQFRHVTVHKINLHEDKLTWSNVIFSGGRLKDVKKYVRFL